MSNQATDPKNDGDNKDAAVKPEPETLHTTDPQEHMEGPVSSLMQSIAGKGDENDGESKEEADAKKDANK
ncbi:MAG: hypothetical protein EOO13_06575 [Chitinophagaceae bacterium]|nr:MAG: hypothetical protein EOO13_06575 [Chitinophagaceae bacterium]